MADLEHPPIDLFINRLPEHIQDDHALIDHVRTALQHNLSLINDRLDGIEKVFEELHALAASVEEHDPFLARQMRTTISRRQAVELQGARWLIEAFIQGLDPYAMRGVENVTKTRQGSQRAKSTIHQQRDPIKERWREEAQKRRKANASLSVNAIATRLRKDCIAAHKDPMRHSMSASFVFSRKTKKRNGHTQFESQTYKDQIVGWSDHAQSFIAELYLTRAAIDQISQRYFDGHPVLFSERQEGLDYLIEGTENLIDLYNRVLAPLLPRHHIDLAAVKQAIPPHVMAKARPTSSTGPGQRRCSSSAGRTLLSPSSPHTPMRRSPERLRCRWGVSDAWP